MTTESDSLVTKARRGDGPETRAAVRHFLTAFESFKEANDARLAALEKKRDDVVLVEKIERLNKALGAQQQKIERLALQGQRPAKGAAAPIMDERKAAFRSYMRAGDASGLLETKALVAGVDQEGGYLAPDETERMIAAALKAISPIRSIATVRAIGGNLFRKPASQGDTASGWVGETAARPQTATPTLQSLDFPTMELYAMPAASQTLLDDAVVDIEAWLASEVEAEFAAQESAAFVNGDGVARPKGFLAYPIVDNATQGFGEIGYIATGVAGAFPAANPADKLLDLVYAGKQAYRANGRFVMNRQTVAAICKFKDADGNYIWQPSTEAGTPATLLGFPVIEAEDMPAIAANAPAVAFGDFERGYLVVDRAGVRVLRDPYSAKPYVLFYTTKRVGGGVQNFDAIKVLKFSAA
ncbi:MAG: phage major capsid protein [Parvularculaceae bacterium]|nr:phage major capsid protein [Parvularculaceae bacterium]